MLRLKMTSFKRHHVIYKENTDRFDAEEIVDRIRVMRKQEQSSYKNTDYLADTCSPEIMRGEEQRMIKNRTNKDESTKETNQVNEFCREKIVEWSFRVVDYFNINREVVAISTSYLDRFLSRNICDKRTFKLAATTSLYLAIKLNESHKPDMMKVLSDLSRGEFSTDEISEMEKAILESLSWLLHPPTSSCFVEHMLKLIGTYTDLYQVRRISALATFFTELSICDYYFTTQFPSTVAVAAILNAMEIFNLNEIPTISQDELLERISLVIDTHHRSQELIEARRRLWFVYDRSEEFALRDVEASSSSKKPSKKSSYTNNASQEKHQSPVSVYQK